MDNEIIKQKTSPKDFFMHLLAMVALYFSAVSFDTIVWQLINLSLPDPLEQYFSAEHARGLIRASLAFLIILYPVYILTSWRLSKSYLQDQSKRNLRVRKWLLYFTLFVSSLIVIFSLVALLRSFLGGELSLRFFLKLLSTIFVAGAIFGYYLRDLRR